MLVALFQRDELFLPAPFRALVRSGKFATVEHRRSTRDACACATPGRASRSLYSNALSIRASQLVCDWCAIRATDTGLWISPRLTNPLAVPQREPVAGAERALAPEEQKKNLPEKVMRPMHAQFARGGDDRLAQNDEAPALP